MNYIKEINAFRNHLKTNPLEATTQALWYVIIDYHNSCGWEKWITIDNSRLVAELGVSEKTLISHRNKLIQAGILEYKSQQRKKSSGRYNLLSFEAGEAGKKKTTGQTAGNTTADKKADNKTTVNITADKKADQGAVREEDRVADPSDLNKLNETKLNNNSSTTTTIDVSDGSLKEIVAVYEKNMGHLFPVSSTPKILDWMNVFEIDAITLAIQIAAEQNKRTFRYLEGILRNWQAKGLIKVEMIKQEMAEFEQKRKNNQSSQGQGYTNSKPGKLVNYKQPVIDFDKLEQLEQENIDRILQEGAS